MNMNTPNQSETDVNKTSKHTFSSYIVGADDSNTRLDRWIRRRISDLIPQSLIEQSARKRKIVVNSTKCQASTRVIEGDVIQIADDIIKTFNHVKNQSESKSINEKKADKVSQYKSIIKEWVIYESDDIIAINKPSGFAVQGGSGIDISIDDISHFLVKQGADKPRLVHRLDKDTSGVLLLAKNVKSASKLAEMFKSKDVEKTYWALVVGVPSKEYGKIDLPLLKSEISHKEKVIVENDEGKSAITHFRVIDKIGNKYSWLELKPLTGRMHQLRVHTSEIGCPIVGDGKYGGAKAYDKTMGFSNKLHLHAREINISLTKDKGGNIKITADIPKHMQDSFKIVGFHEC